MIAVFALLLLSAFLIIRHIYERNWSRELSVSLRFSQPAVYAGKGTDFTEVLENRKRMPVPVLEAGFRVPKGIEFVDTENIRISDYIYKRDVFCILGMERITRRYHLHCPKRGVYQISQVSLKACDPLFLEQLIAEPQVTDQLYVYAARTNIREILRPLTSVMGEREAVRRVYEDPFAFASIREYTPSDPMKTVNWKASAKTGSLMVNTFTSVQNEQLFLYLDVEDRNIIRQQQLIEDGISVAASLAETLSRKGLEVGVAVNVLPPGSSEPAVFMPARGREHLKKIEQFLASDFSLMETVPLDRIAGSHMPGTIPVLISKNDTPQTRDFVRRLAGSERNAIWVLSAAKGEMQQTPQQLRRELEMHSGAGAVIVREVSR